MIITLSVITTSYITQFETRTRSSAANPTGIPYVCKGDCVYSVGGAGAAATCYRGYCLDPNQSCSFNINCGWVAGCTGQDQVSCPGFETPTVTPTNNPAPTATPTLLPIPTDFFFTPTPKPKNQKYICSSNCESESDGSYKFCYNECVPDKAGYARAIGCDGNGWRYGTDQIDTTCRSTPTPNPRYQAPSPTTAQSQKVYSKVPIGGLPDDNPTPTPTPFPQEQNNPPLPTATPETIAFSPPSLTPLILPTPTPLPIIGPKGCLLEPIKLHGNAEDKLDLIIFPSKYSSLDDFRTDSQTVVKVLENTNWNTRRNSENKLLFEKFNFWMYRGDFTRAIASSCSSYICWDEEKTTEETQESCGGDRYLIILNEPFQKLVGGAAHFGGGAAVYKSLIVSSAHELGHSLCYLDDEYVYDSLTEGLSRAAQSRLHNCSPTFPCTWQIQNPTAGYQCLLGCTVPFMFKSTEDSIMNALSIPPNLEFNDISFQACNRALSNYK